MYVYGVLRKRSTCARFSVSTRAASQVGSGMKFWSGRETSLMSSQPWELRRCSWTYNKIDQVSHAQHDSASHT